MKSSADIAADPAAADNVVSTAAASKTGSKEPALWVVLLIFWGAFAAAIAMTAVLNPDMFIRQDPDSLMRMVQVRDLLAGQGWFDLMQHRMDPPGGALMHWSRLIDAPIATLVALGDLVGIGERLALIAWPLLLLLALMTGVALSATALAGRGAAVPALILSLVFLDPLLFFFPGTIDHHNAQYALTALMLAMALRLDRGAVYGVLLGCGLAMMLAIGLEMIPYVAIFSAIVAIRWAMAGLSARATAAFGLAFAAAPAALYAGSGSREAAFVCDALSWAMALPAAVAGLGLAALALVFHRTQAMALRLAGLAVLGAATVAALLLVAPDCLSGPYGKLSAELRAVWLDTVLEALPIADYAARRPVAAIATLGPPIVALAVVLIRLWHGPTERRIAWGVPLALLATALALSFYQVRTLPYANVAAIAVLGAWLAELAARHCVTTLRSRAALPVLAGFLVACPIAHVGLGWVATEALAAATAGRLAPPERPTAPKAQTAGLSNAERECLDPASAGLLAGVPQGRLLTPVFFGPSALLLSPHDVIAGPYHRSEQAILDATYATHKPPHQARAIIDRRAVDYIAICATSRESAVASDKAPEGLLARLLAGATPAWLEPVESTEKTQLRLWRVTELRGPQP